MGKTALALNFLWGTVTNPFKAYPVAFFSLEMGSKPATKRLQANVCGVELNKIRNPKSMSLDDLKRFENGSQTIANYKIFIDESAPLGVLQLRAKVRQLIKKYGQILVIIDYLQMMEAVKTSSQSNREQEVSRISREIKATAKEFDIPIIAISSLNRSGQTRDSGNIDFDADIKINLKKPTPDEIKEFNLTEDHRLLDLIKHRNGETGYVTLRFDKPHQRFIDESEIKPDYDRPFAGIRYPTSSQDAKETPF
jgi:replicative DNA helicase